jgi:ectoine hydroxylase-related dioxygenase (phytanoyl-CoA dioxygenase family)
MTLKKILSDKQIEQYRDQGFVNIGQIFSEGEFADIKSEYDRLVTKDSQTLGNEEQGRFPYRAMMNFRSKKLKAIIQHRALLSAVVQLLGEDIRFWWDQGINKSPGAGSYIAWHQDNGYANGVTPEYVTCWLALDDSSPENGGLYVIPRSQKAGPRDHEWRSVHAVVPDEFVEADKAVPLNAKAGDMLLFSSYLIHQTVGNNSKDKQRRAWVMQYCRGDQANETTGEIYDNRPWVVKEGEYVETPWAEREFNLRGDRP